MNEQPESEAVDTSDWPDTDDIRGWVEWRTRKLLSGDPYWQPIANQLRAHGLDPETTILADLWPEDSSMEEGVVVTLDGRVFSFQYDWLNRSRHQGTFRDWSWEELTSCWRVDAYPCAAVAIALQIASEQGTREMLACQRTDPDKLRAHVEYETQLARSGGPNRQPVAGRFAERGIDVTRAGMGSIYSDREARPVNFIVTAKGAILQYAWVCSSSEGWAWTVWNEVTDTSMLDEHEQDLVRVALEVAKAG
jgi:hypothetical protein